MILPLIIPRFTRNVLNCDPKEGFYFLERIMENAEPSCGYSVLVQVLSGTRHNVAITTNFDSMIEDAMHTYTRKKPLVCGHESLTGFVAPIITRPLIAKIHRDLLYAPKSSTADTCVPLRRLGRSAESHF